MPHAYASPPPFSWQFFGSTPDSPFAGLDRDALGAVGLVTIGRNEGERLDRCLAAAQSLGLPTVYVDSGSTDGSVELARSRGAVVHELDLERPFTAARARNAGWRELLELAPNCRYVQFIDGDCELAPEWLPVAVQALEANAQLAAVCGRRRERFPDASLYNKLCDLEWDTPVGPAFECGGDVLMRVDALRTVGGYDPSLIAGEEPELCVRLRDADWSIERLDAEMTLHDAAMERFGQWWQRSKRCGHTYAAAFARYGLRRETRYARSVASVLIWALAFPVLLAAIAGAGAVRGQFGWSLAAALIAVAGYARLVIKIARAHEPDTGSRRDAWIYAAACVAGKLPELAGLTLFACNRLLGRRARLIEYKGPADELGREVRTPEHSVEADAASAGRRAG